MLNPDLLKNDLKSILSSGNTAILKDGSQIQGYLNKNTKLYFDNGLSDEVVTFLCTHDFSIGEIISVKDVDYEIYRIDHENIALNRLFLRVVQND